MHFSLYCSILAISTFSAAHCANILALTPFPAFSHTAPFAQFFIQLASRHHVTLVTSNPETVPLNIANLRVIDVSEVYQTELPTEVIEIVTGYDVVKHLEVFRQVMQHPDVRDLILNPPHSFDLVISDIATSAWAAIAQRFGCPLIGLLPYDDFVVNQLMGNPPPTNVPWLPATTFHKIFNLFTGTVLVGYDFFYTQQNIDHYLNEYFPEVDGFELERIQNAPNLLFVHQIPGFHIPRATFERTKYIGGIDTKNGMGISEYAKEKKSARILISLDNYADEAMPTHVLNALQNVSVHLLWVQNQKTPKNLLHGEGVTIVRQSAIKDIFTHENLLLFISTGDNYAISLALEFNVPLVIVPRGNNAQELQNGVRVEEEKLGVQVAEANLMQLEHYVNDMIQDMNNRQYRSTISQFSQRISQPMTGLETMLLWTEWLLENSQIFSEAITSPFLNLGFIESWYIDIVATLGIAAFIGAAVALFFGKKITDVVSYLASKRELVF